MRRQGGHVAADIGIVGGFDEPADLPPIPAVPCDPAGDQQPECREAEPPIEAKARSDCRDPEQAVGGEFARGAAVEDFGAHASPPWAKGRCPRLNSRSRTPSSAPGPGTNKKPGPAIFSPVAPSTRTGSTRAPVRLLTSCTAAPSGAKWRLPQADKASRTGWKSRPRSVSRYSSRGGWSL